jgi:hypothetical protein
MQDKKVTDENAWRKNATRGIELTQIADGSARKIRTLIRH